MEEVKYDEVETPDGSFLAVVTQQVSAVAGAGNPYLTGVYVPGSEDGGSAYQEVGSPTKTEALATHRKTLSDWQNAKPGICITCGTRSQDGLGWIVDERHYCDDMSKSHEPLVCTECIEGEPCEKHPNFCSRCESPSHPCDTHLEMRQEMEDWEMEE